MLAVLTIAVSGSYGQSIYYVKPTGNDANSGTGNWNNAFATIGKAVSIAPVNAEIWVAAGMYKEAQDPFFLDGLQLQAGVHVYGGFAPSGSPLFSARNTVLYPTIFSGDNNNNNSLDNTDRAFFFDIQSAAGARQTIIDGVTFQGIYSSCVRVTDASAAVPLNMLVNDVTMHTSGWGLYCLEPAGVSLTVTNARFERLSYGISIGGGSLSVDECSFLNNYYGIDGTIQATPFDAASAYNLTFQLNNSYFGNNTEAITIITDATNLATNQINFNSENNVFVNNANGCINTISAGPNTAVTYAITANTFVGNGANADDGNGSILCDKHNQRSSGNIDNSVAWNNSGPILYGGYSDILTSVSVRYSNLYNATLLAGPGNTNFEPQFANISNPLGADAKSGTADDGLRLSNCSPLLNAGNNLLIRSGTTTDITGASRIANSQVDMGAYEYQLLPVATGTSINGDKQTRFIYSGLTTFLDDGGNCRAICTVTPNGTDPVRGRITASTFIESGPYPGNEPLVWRHYEIEPNSSPGTATARITLYFTQTDFDIYNSTKPATFPLLPFNQFDVAATRNLLILQYHGTSTTHLPRSYSLSSEFIDPNDADIVWNNTYSRWEVSFNVAGFSGFFVTTSLLALPLRLLEFEGKENHSFNKLTWKTASEINTAVFIVERSGNGANYTPLGTVPAAGNSSSTSLYQYMDQNPLAGKNFYRLKTVDIDGKFTYSPSIVLNTSVNNNAMVFPNPFVADMVVTANSSVAGNGSLRVFDFSGRLLISKSAFFSKGNNVINVEGHLLKPGAYLLEVQTPAGKQTIKVTKQ